MPAPPRNGLHLRRVRRHECVELRPINVHIHVEKCFNLNQTVYFTLNCSNPEFAISFPAASSAVTFHLSGLPEIMLACISGVTCRTFCADFALASVIPATSLSSTE